MSKDAYESVVNCGPEIIAVKADQTRVRADKMCSSEPFEPYACTTCAVKYHLGHHVAFPPSRELEYYYSALQTMLDAEHRSHREEHLDSYSIDNP